MDNGAAKQPYLIKTIAKLLDDTDVKYEISYSNEDSSHVITYRYKPKKISHEFRVRCFYTDEHCGVVIDGFDPIERGKLDLAYLVANDLAIEHDQFKFVVYDNVVFSMVAVITNRVGEEDEELLAKQMFRILSDSNKILPSVYGRYKEAMEYELSPKKVLEGLSDRLMENDIPFNLKTDGKNYILRVCYQKWNKTFNIDVFFQDKNEVRIIIDGFGKCSARDRERCLETINSLNVEYKFNFYIDGDEVVANYVMNTPISLDDLQAKLFALIGRGVNTIEAVAPKIAECITVTG